MALAQATAREAAAAPQRSRHFVHVFPTFAYGGVPIRIADVISRLDGPYRHSILSLNGQIDAKSRIADGVDVDFPAPPTGRLPGLLPTVAHWLKAAQPDALLTYNWGAIEWALSSRLRRGLRHVHFESGFGPEEADHQLPRRCLFRRLALGGSERLVVPSHLLVGIATEQWHVDPNKILLLPNGVNLARYRPDAGKPDMLAELGDCPRPLVGTVSPLRKEKAIDRLLRASAPLLRKGLCTLLIAGEGAERPTLEALAAELGIASQTRFLGHVEDVAAFMPLLDVFCLTSDTEQMPNALLQAMASACSVAAVDVGDVARILSEQNRALVVPRDEEAAFTATLDRLLNDAELRRTLGAANRRQAERNYDLEDMVAAYEALFLGKTLPQKIPRTE